MSSDLTLRPGLNDHLVVADLLAPGGRGWATRMRPTIQRLVLDGTVALRQPQFAADAAEAAVPVSIDPMTFLLQRETAPGGWSDLPFGSTRIVSSDELGTDLRLGELVDNVLTFSIEHGATIIVPPYFYSSDPKGPYFIRGLRAISLMRKRLDELGSSMKLLPVLCGRIDGFGRVDSFASGIDWFAAKAKDCGADNVAVLMSPVGDFSDNYAKTLKMFSVMARLEALGLKAHAWRQGALGPALIAAGASGYETGLRYGNRTDVSNIASNRRPLDDDKSGGGGGGHYFVPTLGRWLIPAQVHALSEVSSTRGLIACDDGVGCCSSLTETMTHRREHAARSHRRRIQEIDAMPPLIEWRMNAINQNASRAVDAIVTMNKVLKRAGVPLIKSSSHEAIKLVSEHLGHRQQVA